MLRISAWPLVLLTAAVSSVGYAYYREDEPRSFLTAPVERGRVATIVRATGTLNPVLSVEVSSQLSGRMAQVFVDFNDRVRAGQPLARLDPEIFASKVSEAWAALKIAEATVQVQRASQERAQAAVASAEAARGAVEAMVASYQAKFEEAERQLQRRASLASTASISVADLTSARAQRDSFAAELRAMVGMASVRQEAIAVAEAEVRMAEANLRNSEAVVEQKRAALHQAELDLARTELRSPIDGFVIKRDVNPGQTVAVSLEAKMLFKIANDLREMEVHGKIDEADVGRLKPGQAVSFTVDAYPDKVFAGRVLQVRVSPEVAQNVVTYTAVVSAANPDQSLFPGMTANLRITVEEAADALMVPNQALRFRPDGATSAGRQALGGGPATVWMIGADGKPSPAQIALGRDGGGRTQMLSGPLAEGQPVIVGVAPPAPRTRLLGLRLGL